MQQATAHVRFLRVSPRKVRLLANMVRGMDLVEALAQLRVMHRKSSEPMSKLLSSAAANAKELHEAEPEQLFVKEIRVDEGATLKRFRPRAFGRAGRILKRSSHISVILGVKRSGKTKDKKNDKKVTTPTTAATGASGAKKTEGKKPVVKKDLGKKAPAPVVEKKNTPAAKAKKSSSKAD